MTEPDVYRDEVLAFYDEHDIDGVVGYYDERSIDVFERRRERGCLCVRDDDGGIIGIVDFSHESRRTNLLHLLVHPDRRREGVATQLIDTVLDDSPAGRVRVHCDAEAEDGDAFFNAVMDKEEEREFSSGKAIIYVKVDDGLVDDVQKQGEQIKKEEEAEEYEAGDALAW